MQSKNQRPPALIGIIIYKSIIVLVLATVAIISGYSWRNYDALATWTASYLVDGEFVSIKRLLELILHADVNSLRLIARVSSIYAVLMGLATAGLWYQKAWANPLVVVMAGLPLPIEMMELIHDFSIRRLIILTVNILVVIRLLKHWLQADKGELPAAKIEESTQG